MEFLLLPLFSAPVLLPFVDDGVYCPCHNWPMRTSPILTRLLKQASLTSGMTLFCLMGKRRMEINHKYIVKMEI